jgi:hypothetical protein
MATRIYILLELKQRGGYMHSIASIYQPDSPVDAATAAISVGMTQAGK